VGEHLLAGEPRESGTFGNALDCQSEHVARRVHVEKRVLVEIPGVHDVTGPELDVESVEGLGVCSTFYGG
jgi:hypothetical protein